MMVEKVLATTPTGVPVIKGQEVVFKTEVRRRYGPSSRYIEEEHLGRIVGITTSGSGVVLHGIDVNGVFSRSFDDIPELRR